MVRPDRAGGEVETGPSALDRLVYFSDAVFAIAITLLILRSPTSGSTATTWCPSSSRCGRSC